MILRLSVKSSMFNESKLIGSENAPTLKVLLTFSTTEVVN